MNDKEYKEHLKKIKLREGVIEAAKGTVLQAFRYYRGIYRRESDSNLLEHQVVKFFEMGMEVGEKIGKGDL